VVGPIGAAHFETWVATMSLFLSGQYKWDLSNLGFWVFLQKK